MFCGKCGTKVSAGMDFCPNCGNNLKANDRLIDPAGATSSPQQPVYVQQSAQPVAQTESKPCSCGWAGINVFAVIGFALAFILGIPGLVFSIMGYQEGERTGKHKGLAIAGIVISIINIILTAIFVGAFINAVLDSSNTRYPYL